MGSELISFLLTTRKRVLSTYHVYVTYTRSDTTKLTTINFNPHIIAAQKLLFKFFLGVSILHCDEENIFHLIFQLETETDRMFQRND